MKTENWSQIYAGQHHHSTTNPLRHTRTIIQSTHNHQPLGQLPTSVAVVTHQHHSALATTRTSLGLRAPSVDTGTFSGRLRYRREKFAGNIRGIVPTVHQHAYGKNKPQGLPTPTRSPHQGEHCRFRHAYRLPVTQPGQRPVAGVRAGTPCTRVCWSSGHPVPG